MATGVMGLSRVVVGGAPDSNVSTEKSSVSRRKSGTTVSSRPLASLLLLTVPQTSMVFRVYFTSGLPVMFIHQCILLCSSPSDHCIKPLIAQTFLCSSPVSWCPLMSSIQRWAKSFIRCVFASSRFTCWVHPPVDSSCACIH